MFGAAGNVGFFRGDPATTRISSSVASMTISSKSQVSLTARLTMFGRDDRWRFESDHRFQWTSQETFGLGLTAPEADGELVEFDFYRVYQSVYTACGGTCSPGAASTSTAMPTSARGRRRSGMAALALLPYSDANGLPLDTQTSAGASAEYLGQPRQLHQRRARLARAHHYRGWPTAFSAEIQTGRNEPGCTGVPAVVLGAPPQAGGLGVRGPGD